MHTINRWSLVLLLFAQTTALGVVNYRFEVIAKTGDKIPYGSDDQNEATIINIGTGPSINDSGKVAFTAFFDSGPYQLENGVLLVKDGNTFFRKYFVVDPSSIGYEVQINNKDQVVWYEKSNDGLFTNINRLDTSVGGAVIGRGSIHSSFPQFFNIVLPWASINNNGGVVFSGDLPSGGTVLAFEDDNIGPGPDTISSAIGGLPNYFPMIADNNRIVFRSGNSITSPLIVFMDETFNETTALWPATSANFNAIGKRPGISDDGKVVVFAGDDKVEGRGIFMVLIDQQTRFKIVDITNDSNLDFRVGVNSYIGSNNIYSVVYMAKNSLGKLGLYKIDIDISNPLNPATSDHVLLAEEGGTIGNFVITVENINIYDPINNSGLIVFWIKTILGTQAIIRATQNDPIIKFYKIDVDDVIQISNDAGNAIVNPIWDENNSFVSKQIADSAKDEGWVILRPGYFTVHVTLEGEPYRPTWEPTCRYNWGIPGTDKNGLGDFPGWSGSFTVHVPEEVGKYTLNLALYAVDENEKVLDARRTSHTLYITYLPSKKDRPRTSWLKLSTEWASGAKTDTQVAELIQDAISKSKWYYMPNGLPYNIKDPTTGVVQHTGISINNCEDLVEGNEFAGNCRAFAETWSNLCQVLGLDAKSEPVKGSGAFVRNRADELDPSQWFVTKTGLVSFDNNPGNVHADAPGARPDRWTFKAHYIGRYGSFRGRVDTWYDPTFQKIWTGLADDFIAWQATGEGTDPVTGLHSWIADNKYRIVCVPHSNGMHGWGEHIYRLVQPYPEPAPVPSRVTSSILLTSVPRAEARLQDIFAEKGLDNDEDGIFEHLDLIVNVDVTTPGRYVLTGLLRQDGIPITDRVSVHAFMPVSVPFEAPLPGIVAQTILFSGEDIRRSGIDGPYVAEFSLYKQEVSAPIDTLFYSTGVYNHMDFGEIAGQLGMINDHAVDQDGDGVFDALVLDVSLEIFQKGQYHISSILYSHDGKLITSLHLDDPILESGIVRLYFDGNTIRRLGQNGPYAVTVNLHSANSSQIDHKDYTTAAYEHTRFALSAHHFTGTYNDRPTDADEDGLFDGLDIEVGIHVGEVGIFKIDGWLFDDANRPIDVVKYKGALEIGEHFVVLQFNGVAIRQHGRSGAYYLKYLSLSTTSSIIDFVEDAYVTSSYVYTDFEAPLWLQGDTNNDLKVDAIDLNSLSWNWLRNNCMYPDWCEGCDLNIDGSVDLRDYAILSEYWLEWIKSD